MVTTPRKPSKAAQEAELWKARAIGIKAEYDVLKTSRLRRQPVRETKSEGAIYSPSKRSYGTNIGRDLERNYSPARGILHQFRMNVVGSLGKIQVNTKGGEEAAAWFNQIWAKDCDFRDSLHFSSLLQNIVAAVQREGDMLAVFDDGVIEDSGKLITWESDQIVPLSDAVLAAKGYPGHVQDGGIIRDTWGRVVAYSVTGKRGLTVIDNAEDALVWKREQARLPKNPWRLNQGRGVPCILTAAASFLDLYEMLSRELQTAKRAAAQWAFITRGDAVTDWDSPATGAAYLPENDGKASTTVSGEGANSATEPEARNYESLEEFTGGYTDYGQTGDDVKWSPTDRPNVHMPEFIEAVQCQAGAAFGLARAYALLRADSSYTSFRGDMIMSWAGAFYPMQKWLERDIADWCGVKAITWAIKKKKIKPLPEGWEQTQSWTWPTMPEVDQLDAENATAQALKNGTTDFAALLGPDWRKRLEGLAEQINEIKRLGIPLSILEMKSGGVANNPKKDNEKPVTTEGNT
jgi:capsid protein